MAYVFAALIVLNTQPRGQLAWIAGLHIAYWAALKFIPVPGFGAGDFQPGHTLTDYIDRMLIPGQLYMCNRDPEGFLGTLPAVATALAGVVTGQLLKNARYTGYAKAAAMVAAGLASLGVALLWDRNFPINKNLWSSFFVLYCAGWNLLFLSVFYLIIDVWRFRAWSLPLAVIGSNSILIYLAQRIVDFEFTTHRVFDGVLKFAGGFEPLLFSIASVAVQWLLLYWLYHKRIFLKV